ncbi:hypothetical protein [Chitinophaga sp.]|uniref:hypothetical protein n=1 Tax=Chitinophaga sp. TaxID=1869181 RepID=UPI0031D2567C
MKIMTPLLLAGMLASTTIHAQQTITGLATPESAVAWKDGYFVSQIGPRPDAFVKDGDGSIAWVKAGKVQSARYFNDTLNAPKGLEIIGHTLYVTDMDHLKGYDIDSRKKVFDLIPEGKNRQLNDLTVVHDSLLVVSDCVTGDILLVNPRTADVKLLGNIVVANGVTYDEAADQLYVCSMGPEMNGTGQLFHRSVDRADDVFQPVKNSPVGLFDGIVQLDATHLLLSDWITVKGPKEGLLHVYDLKAGTSKSMKVIHSPADIALDKRHQALLIPVMLDGKMEVWPLKKLSFLSHQ